LLLLLLLLLPTLTCGCMEVVLCKYESVCTTRVLNTAMSVANRVSIAAFVTPNYRNISKCLLGYHTGTDIMLELTIW
jgi:hypothetical protein